MVALGAFAQLLGGDDMCGDMGRYERFDAFQQTLRDKYFRDTSGMMFDNIQTCVFARYPFMRSGSGGVFRGHG